MGGGFESQVGGDSEGLGKRLPADPRVDALWGRPRAPGPRGQNGNPIVPSRRYEERGRVRVGVGVVPPKYVSTHPGTSRPPPKEVWEQVPVGGRPFDIPPGPGPRHGYGDCRSWRRDGGRWGSEGDWTGTGVVD